MKKVAIIGAGELGIQILHLLLESGEYEISGFYDDLIPLDTVLLDKYNVLNKTSEIMSDFNNMRFDVLAIGIGYKHMDKRKEFYDYFSKSIPFATIIHNSCIIHPTSIIEKGSVLYPGCIIDKNVHIGQNVLLNLGVIISHDSIIENNSFFAPSATLGGFVKIQESCFIGIGVNIIDNITITKEVILGAGALVINNIKKPGKYIGFPAKQR